MYSGRVTSITGVLEIATASDSFYVHDLIGYGDNAFNDGYYLAFAQTTDEAAPEAEFQDIIDYVSATGLFYTGTFSAVATIGDVVSIQHASIAEPRLIGLDAGAPFHYTGGVHASSLNITELMTSGIDYAAGSYLLKVFSTVDGNPPLGETALVTAWNASSGAMTISPALSVVLEPGDWISLKTGDLYPSGRDTLTIDLVTGSGWETVAVHEVLTVTGDVQLRFWLICTESLTGSNTIQFGNATATDAYIASTTKTDLIAGEYWIDATPAETVDGTDWEAGAIGRIITGGVDVGYEIVTAAATDGTIMLLYEWQALTPAGRIVKQTTGGTAL